MSKLFKGKYSFLLGLILLMPCLCQADTVVPGGEISADTTWTKAASPYIIREPVQVDEGVTLTIEPGAVIKFGFEPLSWGSYIEVYGRLVAQGTDQDKIRFTSLKDDPAACDTDYYNGLSDYSDDSCYWSLNLYSAAGSQISNVSFSNLGAIDIENTDLAMQNISIDKASDGAFFIGGNVSIDHLSMNAAYGQLYATEGQLAIRNSAINLDSFGGTGIYFNNEHVTIASTTAIDLSGDVLDAYGGAVNISNSTISAGAEANGLYFSDSETNLASTTVQNAGYSGISIAGGKLAGDRLNLVNNGTGVQVADGYGGGIVLLGMAASNSLMSGSRSGTINLSDVTISNSRLVGNSQWGINNSGTATTTAINNWWGDASGPQNASSNPGGKGDLVSDKVNYSPWLTEDPWLPKAPTGFDSVAFIPGIEASRLYQTATCFGQPCEKQLWTPLLNSDTQKLYLTVNGSSTDPTIHTRDVVDTAYHLADIYGSFIDSMNALVASGTIAAFESLPYDWRLDLNEITDKGATTTGGNISYLNNLPSGQVPYMIAELAKLAAQSKSGKVTIVAHSNGGLVTKALLQKLQAMKAAGQSNLIDKIDRVILVAVPELGTPEAIPSMLNGYGTSLLGGIILKESVARGAAENMPSMYNLLPSAKYFNTVAEPVINFDSSAANYSAGLAKYGSQINSAQALEQFLLGQLDKRPKPAVDNTVAPDVMNSKFIASAKVNHNKLDDWQYPTSTEVIQIAGWGVPTVKAVTYSAKSYGCDFSYMNNNYCLKMQPVMTNDGDGTVVSPSAVGMASSSETYYLNISDYNLKAGTFNSKQHKSILAISSVQKEIGQIISNVKDLPSYFSIVKPDPLKSQRNLLLGVHSPVSLDAYDQTGDHTGIVENPDPTSDLQTTEENIPNSSYLDFGEDKYIALPNGTYNIQITGTGFGTFTFDQQEVIDGKSSTTAVYADIPVSPLTKAQVTIAATGTSVLSLDPNGDGQNLITVKPDQEFDPVLYLQLMKGTVKGFDLKKNTEKEMLDKIDNMIKSIQKGKIKNADRQIKNLIHQTKWRMSAKGHCRKRQQIPDDDKNVIIQMLNELLTKLS